jgi:glycosyltransferase involved in cell wall biosynthesis
MIDVVGHFGSLLSYATVASEVARALRAAELLGDVSNLDADWHPQLQDLRQTADERSSHVLVFAVPNHYLDGYTGIYGRERAALFASPNTDRLAKEHAETCAKFGRIIVPSAWCEDVVARSLPPNGSPEIVTVPLGVSPLFCANKALDLGRQMRDGSREKRRALHLSTDRFWPGRKGTEELLAAWRRLVDGDPDLSWRLTVSVPPPLVLPATLTVADMELSDHVEVAPTPERGMSDAELAALYADADLIIAPSRCEGFGMMILAAVVNHCPLVTTYNTGHADFLADVDGWLGIPTSHNAPLSGEAGLAPIVEPGVLANTIRGAMVYLVRQQMISAVERDLSELEDGWGTWPWATTQWVEYLAQWAKETM